MIILFIFLTKFHSIQYYHDIEVIKSPNIEYNFFSSASFVVAHWGKYTVFPKDCTWWFILELFAVVV